MRRTSPGGRNGFVTRVVGPNATGRSRSASSFAKANSAGVDAGGALPNARKQVEPVHARHHDVEDEQLAGGVGRRCARVDDAQRLACAMSRFHGVESRPVQDGGNHAGQFLLVVDKQDPLIVQGVSCDSGFAWAWAKLTAAPSSSCPVSHKPFETGRFPSLL